MAAYYIGANDEHGQNPPTAGKRTPVLPYVNRSFYENEYNRPAKNCFIQACLRCGFDVFDVKPELTDISVSRRVQRINAQRLTLLVTFGYNAFGSGSSFNSAAGILTFYAPQGRRPEESRVLAVIHFLQQRQMLRDLRQCQMTGIQHRRQFFHQCQTQAKRRI